MMARLAIVLLAVVTAFASAGESAVQALIDRDTPPPGVVFELVENDHEALQTLLPRLLEYIETLREHHPGIGIAVVSHGNEQFALSRPQRGARTQLHEAVEGLGRDRDVEVAVCATYASWRDVPPEAFPDYVQVVESGPARINDFRALGYRVIRLRPPGADAGRIIDTW
jgi:intracellular sulfur oxidation DsrE/DsrF family protein